MPLKTPQQYVESLRDGRVTYWDGERIDDITTHPRFKVPIAMTAKDYDYDSAECGASRQYKTEEGERAHRIYQIPRSEEDLANRIEMMGHTSIGTLVVRRVHGADERQGPGWRRSIRNMPKISSGCTATAATTICARPR